METPEDQDQVLSCSKLTENMLVNSSLSAQLEMKQECSEMYRDVSVAQQRLEDKTGGSSAGDHPSPLLAVSKAKQLQLQAQVEAQESQELRLMSTHRKVVEAVLVSRLEESQKQLAELLTVMKTQQKELSASLETEEQTLQQRQELGRKLDCRLAEVPVPQDQETTADSQAKALTGKIKKALKYRDHLTERLSCFLNTHFPPPQPANDKTRSRHGSGPVDRTLGADDPQWESLNMIIEVLINKSADTPNDPYIQVEPRYWPPYVELLLRCGIAERHPQDSTRLRLVQVQQ